MALAGLGAVLETFLTGDPFGTGLDAALAADLTGALGVTLVGLGEPLETDFASGLVALGCAFEGAVFFAGASLGADLVGLDLAFAALGATFTGDLLFESLELLTTTAAGGAFLSGPFFFFDLGAIRT